MELSTLQWIVVACVAMSLLALTGAVTLLLPPKAFDRVVMPLVAIAAGTLLGGALFHLLPPAVAETGDGLVPYIMVAAGVLSFVLLEQILQWQHSRRPASRRRPLGVIILVTDGVHNFIDGLAIGSAFVIDTRLGLITWLVIAAHEVPQEIGDYAVLVHSGWGRKSALAYNMLSSLPVLLGGIVAYAAAASINIALLLPFAAGNFIYVAMADLVPELTTPPALRDRVILTAAFIGGLLLLLALAPIG